MGELLAVHRAFTVETFRRNNDSVTATQRFHRQYSNTGRHGNVPDYSRSFKPLLLQKMTDPEADTERTLENTERARAAVGRSSKPTARRHSVALHISSRSLRILFYIFTPIKTRATVRP